ncbi:MAG TPA: glycogen-binding domain-containing protein [Longimicrobiales bacterium]|nr:glycogen-binding domain-containing protein [Longimicrobiales bacterium]
MSGLLAPATTPRIGHGPGFGALSCIRHLRSTAFAAGLVIAAGSGGFEALWAQSWSASLDAGRATFEAGAREIQTSNLVAGIQYVDQRLWFGASGSPALSDDDPLWGGVWAETQPTVRRGSWTALVDIAGQVYGQDDPSGVTSGFGAGAVLLPGLSYRVSDVISVDAYAGGQVYYSGFGAEGTEFTRSVGVLEGRVSATPRSTPLELSASVRHLRAEEGGYTLMTARALGVRDGMVAWAGVGTWLNDGIEDTPWHAGISVRVLERLWARAVIAREAFDPVYLTDPRTTWSVGVSLALSDPPAGDLVADVPLPVQSGAAPVVLRLPEGGVPGPVSVAGDFTDWKPVAMRLNGREWEYAASLEPGVYHYAFVDARGNWFVPEGTPGRKPDGMGGWVAVLIVDG